MATKLIPAPIDNKNLCEDPFEDDVFGNFYATKFHRATKKRRSLIGTLHIDNDDFYIDAIVAVEWFYGGNQIGIQVLAVPPTENFDYMRRDVYAYYKKIFSEWMNPDNPELRVEFYEQGGFLNVSFFFEVEE